jgi:hypothetical protein
VTTSETEWFNDPQGRRVGIRVNVTGHEPVVELVDAEGTVTRSFSAEEAPTVLETLRDGIEFMDITGAESFRLE